MNLFNAIILGAIQGITEFLPISSSGHLVIAQYLIKNFEQPGVLFDVTLHFGTLIATCLYFREDIFKIVQGVLKNDNNQKRMFFYIIAGTIPTGIIGLTFKSKFEAMFESITSVAFMLIITGIILFFTRWFKGDRREFTLIDAIIIGIVQGLAIIPGISRSGSTISVAMFRKIDGESAGRFSFLISIPAIMGAVILESRHITSLNSEFIFTYLSGAFAAFIFGLLSIRFLMSLLKSVRFSYFAYYCWCVGVGTFFI